MVGLRIKDRRKEMGLTQAELAKLVGVSSQVISNWERGYTPEISSGYLKQLSESLACTIDYLLGRVNKPADELVRETAEPLSPNAEIIGPDLIEDQVMVDGIAYKRAKVLLQDGHLADDEEWEILKSVLDGMQKAREIRKEGK